jgi:hypothetical protein
VRPQRSTYLDANQLHFVDGKPALHLSHDQPSDPDANANWLPAPPDQFCLVLRAYVPEPSLLDSTYQLPDVIKVSWTDIPAPGFGPLRAADVAQVVVSSRRSPRPSEGSSGRPGRSLW